MIGFICDATRAGTSTERRKRPDPMQMLSMDFLFVGKRDNTMLDVVIDFLLIVVCSCLLIGSLHG